MALTFSLIKSDARSCVIRVVGDGMGMDGNLPYTNIAALLPASCALKALFAATYATDTDAVEAFAAKGMQFSKLAPNNSAAPGISATELRAVGPGGIGAGVAALRIAVDHSLTN